MSTPGDGPREMQYGHHPHAQMVDYEHHSFVRRRLSMVEPYPDSRTRGPRTPELAAHVALGFNRLSLTRHSSRLSLSTSLNPSKWTSSVPCASALGSMTAGSTVATSVIAPGAIVGLGPGTVLRWKWTRQWKGPAVRIER